MRDGEKRHEKHNILFLHHGGKLIRGSEICLLNLLNKMDRDVFNPTVVCNQEVMQCEVQKLGIESHLIQIPEIMIDGTYFNLHILSYFKCLLKLYKIIKNYRTDLIYSNSGLPAQLGVPLSKLLHIPIIVHLHAPHSKRYAWIWLFKFSDKIFFVSNYIKDHLIRKVRLQGDVRVVYNGIDTASTFRPSLRQDMTLKRNIGIENGHVVIGQVGSLIHRKGVDILLKAFALLVKNHNNLKLVIVGNGDERDQLESLAQGLGIMKEVFFVGETQNAAEYFQNVIDINVLASRSDAFGLTLIEASSCGLPNVCTDCEGMREAVEYGETGLLFEKENPQDLAKKLSLLIEHPQMRKEMGSRGRDKVLRSFSLESYVENIQREILDLVLHER